ncbi:MAG: aminotransferase class III-fold pyridoxal phosphate-dependent enzyme [Pedosphaera sp.]|nr:aminotransferase class III-fold pyridoxal phosphate-dependent enzyme [Pedosphaera sp.]MST01262.1 aminotransferase class III-fold pyridoxal phosphate-dependent enzyme [Pedosphaera sp.]
MYPLVAERVEGIWVWDVDGNRFLDFTAGLAVAAAADERDALLHHALERGLLLLGRVQSMARLMPPLTLDLLEAETGIELLDNALADEEARREAA